jgi:hypothetical protein
MTTTHDKTYGPWTVAAGTTPLYHVIYPNGTFTAVFATTTAGWVLKITSTAAAAAELAETLLVYTQVPRNAVAFPGSVGKLCGTMESNTVWIAMRRYSGSVATEREYCRARWKVLALSVLGFLEDLHRRVRHAHGDLKAANVLVDTERCLFVVSDFGHMDVPGEKVTRRYNPDHCWYYLAMGADPDQPPRGWRGDLVALGYLLADLTWPEAEVRRTFHDQCMARRTAGGDDVVMRELVALRDAEMTRGCGMTLRAYFETLTTGLSWDAARPPPRVFYQALAALFA